MGRTDNPPLVRRRSYLAVLGLAQLLERLKDTLGKVVLVFVGCQLHNSIEGCAEKG